MNSAGTLRSMSEADAILDVRDLGVAVAGRLLLDGVTFRVGCSTTMAVTGPSGCGKTSLLRALAGLDESVTGNVRVRGRARAADGWPAFRREVVYVHQRPVMLDATVRDNLARPFRFRASSGSFDEPEARRLLGELRLDRALLGQAARSLSIGEQQRVALIRALLQDPVVLLLDEPTSALDVAARDATQDVLRRRSEDDGLAVLVVTHDHAHADRWCDEVLDLRAYRADRVSGECAL